MLHNFILLGLITLAHIYFAFISASLAARNFSVVDVWDALTSERPQRKAWAEKEALDYLREQAGKQFDPAIVHTFLDSSIKRKVTRPLVK